MKTTKKTGWPLILAIVAAAVVLALFLWPRILSAGAAHTDWTRQEAQRFIADYQAESGKALDEKRVCWDLAYLDLIGIQPPPSPASGMAGSSTRIRSIWTTEDNMWNMLM